MNKKYLYILPALVILVICVFIHYMDVKAYYDEIINNTGIIQEDIEKELRIENDRAIQNEKEYQNMIKSETSDDEGEKVIEEDTQSTENTDSTDANLKLHAVASLLMDGDNNRVLYEENGNEIMAMASTTKIMTLLVALENAEPDEIVTVSSYAARMPDVQLGIRKGEQYYLGDLYYSLMLESHNDVAVAIAEHVGKTVEGFADMMNNKAIELGCENTKFVTPNGLDAEGHYTSARDLAVIASYAIENEKFIAITNTSSHTFKEINKGRNFMVSNKNRFLYMMDGAIGVKTGFTNGAGYCFVGAVKQPDKTLISVVLGCGWPPNKSLKWSDTKELMNYGVKHYNRKQIFENVSLEPLIVMDGQKKLEALSLEGDLKLLMRDDEKVKIVYELPNALYAPVKGNTIVGNANYYINDVLYKKIPIYTTEDILKIDFPYCFKKIISMWSIQFDFMTN